MGNTIQSVTSGMHFSLSADYNQDGTVTDLEVQTAMIVNQDRLDDPQVLASLRRVHGERAPDLASVIQGLGAPASHPNFDFTSAEITSQGRFSDQHFHQLELTDAEGRSIVVAHDTYPQEDVFVFGLDGEQRFADLEPATKSAIQGAIRRSLTARGAYNPVANPEPWDTERFLARDGQTNLEASSHNGLPAGLANGFRGSGPNRASFEFKGKVLSVGMHPEISNTASASQTYLEDNL